MISIVITSFNEPNLERAIQAVLNQHIQEEYELVIASPDIQSKKLVSEYSKRHKHIKFFQDEGKGKSHALNLLLPRLHGRIIVLTDGDVLIASNAINYILEKFDKPDVGCVSGRVDSVNSKNNLFGYWSHVLCYSAHRLRIKRARKNKFLECSGYLWAFRSGVIKKFPKDVAEDTIVPILFYLKGWKINYADKALVFVKFPSNLKDFLEQKKRTAKSHESLSLYLKPGQIPRMKTFFNELAGSFIVLGYSSNFKEFSYSLALFPFRLYTWFSVFWHKYIKQDYYQDNWARINSAR